jgi:hypothetical protein
MIFAVLFCFFAPWIAFLVVFPRRKQIAQWLRTRRAQGWPTVTGYIEKAHVKAGSRTAVTFEIPDLFRNLQYTIEVGYGYEYQGEFYSGYYHWGITLSEDKTYEIVKRFPPGASVLVRVNPEKPEQSVLVVSSLTELPV